MKIRYLLKHKGKKGTPYRVFIALYDKDTTELIYTGERVFKKDWSKSDGLPIDHDGDLFQAIEKLKNAVLKVRRIMDANDIEVTPFSLKQAYEKAKDQRQDQQQKADQHEKVSITAVKALIDQFLASGLSEYQPSTKKVVTTSINMFASYLKAAGIPRLERKNLTLEVISDYSHWLETTKKLKDSTHGKKMKHVRWFLKHIKFDDAQIKSVKIRSVKPDERNIIHLTADELLKVESIDVSESIEMQKAKDMFLLGCYTGLRVSDLKRISPHRIEGNAIKMTLKKNRKLVSIPLLPVTRSILERYEYSAPRISEQQVNDSIKQVCEKAGINKKIFFKSKKAGQLIETLHPKYEMITTHVAGKTFISLAGERWGLNPEDVAAIVGKDIKTVLGYYLKPNAERAATKMIEAENKLIEDVKRAQMKAVS